MRSQGGPLRSRRRVASTVALVLLGVLPLAGCAGGTAGDAATSTTTAVAPDAGSTTPAAGGGAAASDVTTTTAADSSELPSGVVDLDAEMARTQDVADAIVGRTEHDAQQIVEAAGLQWRVGQREGRTFSLTMDLRPDRITVVIDDGRVTKATAG